MTVDPENRPHVELSSAMTTVTLTRCGPQTCRKDRDQLAVEQPLEIRLGYHFLGKPAQRNIAVTMRTPGADRALALGFLFGEALIDDKGDVESIEEVAPNILRICVKPHVQVDMGSLQRNFYTTSSCGVCGKASLEALEVNDSPLSTDDLVIPASLVTDLPRRLREHQDLFDTTGGVHGAGRFDKQGQLMAFAEDVGRHNAMDKLVGASLAGDALPLAQSIVVWSGRASFELLQKALRARVPIVVAVGAPSSLAVEMADHYGITLIGFTRQQRFNIYTHPLRIHDESVTDD